MKTCCAWCSRDGDLVSAAGVTWGICWDCLVEHFPEIVRPLDQPLLFPAWRRPPATTARPTEPAAA